MTIIVSTVTGIVGFFVGGNLGVYLERRRREKEDAERLDRALREMGMYLRGQRDAQNPITGDVYEDPTTWGQA